MDPQLLFFIIKLVLGGLVSFLSILIMSKTREFYWMMIVIGFLCSYASLIYELMLELGIFAQSKILFLGISLPTLLFSVTPSFFFILALICRLFKK